MDGASAVTGRELDAAGDGSALIGGMGEVDDLAGACARRGAGEWLMYRETSVGLTGARR